MLCFPNAKINLGLSIIERRPDHFHNIESIFYPIPLSDILEVVKSNKKDVKVELKITGMDIPGSVNTNLCVKAYHLLDNVYDLPPVTLHLHKLIPMGAGLGGGSADGAFTLTLLNQAFELGLSSEKMADYASQLGSDCPFFIRNRPSLGEEKGQLLSDVQVNLEGKYLVLVKPPVFVGTAEAYAGVVPHKPEHSVASVIQNPVNLWKDMLCNDFENSIFNKYPMIAEVKAQLYKNGALYSSMTGSGSAVYGIFENEIQLKNVFAGMFYWGGFLK